MTDPPAMALKDLPILFISLTEKKRQLNNLARPAWKFHEVQE
jgi:hypothetical protein